MKKICIDVRMAFHSGIGTYIRNLVPLLAGTFNLTLICSADVVKRWSFLHNCNVILTSCPIYSFQEQVVLPFIVPECDIFWSPHYNLPLAPLRARKKIVTIHDIYHVEGGVSLLKRFYAQQMVKRVVRGADHLITVSRFSKEKILKFTKASEEKISMIYLGTSRGHSVDLNYLLPKRYLLYVGNLAPHKNFKRLLLAFDLVRRKIPDLKLVVVTRNPAPFHEGLIVLNHVLDAELPTIYARACALIHPSLYEGFGLTPLEAMSAGCPVIVSQVASLPEVCGDSALYINPYHVSEIAAAIEKIVQDESFRDGLIKKGLSRSSHFSWEKTAEAHIRVFSE